MSRTKPEDLSKLQVVCSLFSKTVGNDLYFAQQIKESIEASLSTEESSLFQPFIFRAKELVSKLESNPAETGIELVEADSEQAPFSMLDLRVNLLDALKQICRFDKGVVVLTGLKEAICPRGRRWSKTRKIEYEEAICYARAFCQRRSRASSKLSLVIL
ncbi:MAG: hypothetical protein CMI17_04135 [Opitutaceae bacterium]|nr:hypothetical protein [Opitutaceae bacterium]